MTAETSPAAIISNYAAATGSASSSGPSGAALRCIARSSDTVACLGQIAGDVTVYCSQNAFAEDAAASGVAAYTVSTGARAAIASSSTGASFASLSGIKHAVSAFSTVAALSSFAAHGALAISTDAASAQSKVIGDLAFYDGDGAFAVDAAAGGIAAVAVAACSCASGIAGIAAAAGLAVSTGEETEAAVASLSAVAAVSAHAAYAVSANSAAAFCQIRING